MSDFSSQHQKKNGRGSHPNSLAVGAANLVPFKPGQLGNPGGRPRGIPRISNCYERLLKMSVEELQQFRPTSTAEAMALRQVTAALYGLDALPAVKEITDRTEGKAVQQKVILDTSEQAALIREAKTRFEFFIEYNQRFTQYRQLFADHFQMDAETLPDFEVCSVERIIEIVASQFPEASREAVGSELERLLNE